MLLPKANTRNLPLKHRDQPYRSYLARQTIRPRTGDFQTLSRGTRNSIHTLQSMKETHPNTQNQRLHTSSRGIRNSVRTLQTKEESHPITKKEEALSSDKQPKGIKLQMPSPQSKKKQKKSNYQQPDTAETTMAIRKTEPETLTTTKTQGANRIETTDLLPP